MSISDRRRALSQRGAPSSSPSQSRFNYQRRDTDALQKRQQQYAQGGRDNYVTSEVSIFTPAKGDNWIRILPPTWDGAKHYGVDVHVHYGIGADRQAYLCLEKHDKGPCPICKERAELARRGMEEAASELRATYRIAVFCLNRKDPEKGAQLYVMPYRIDQELVVLAQDKRTGEVLWIDDPEHGYDVEFTREGEGLHTKYTGIRIARNPSPLDNDACLDFIIKHPIPGVFLFSTPENMEKVLSGQPAAADKAEPDKPGRNTQALPTRGAAPKPAAVTAEVLLDVALRAADTHNIDVPDAVSDADLPQFVTKKLKEIGKLDDYQELADNAIPY